MRRIWVLAGFAGVVLAVALAGPTLSAEDWPQWRGADRLGIWTETGILREFPADGLLVKWRAPVGPGYAGPAVAGGAGIRPRLSRDRAAHHGTASSASWPSTKRAARCCGRASGPRPTGCSCFSYASGPRATPTVDGDRVYLTGASGRIFCLDAATGAVIWDKDTVAEYDAYVPVWGTSVAPLVEGDRVIFVVGGEPDALVMAFDKHTGEERWKALEPRTEMGYSQLHIIEAGGARQLIVWHPWGLSSLDAGDRRPVLGGAVPGRTGPDCRPGSERFLSPGVGVLHRLDDDAALARPPGPRRCSGRMRAATASWWTASRWRRRTACTRTSRHR